ncbi:hypothetical protein FGG08_003890 [Glutinoglossum americanum]|uniref:Uncharacterized protein n=1 Tax=Glutinoglossum americanum TaxID=1670608 RepID=A0A9P8L389_9PEZI|nr:hypothetical protein FGG08_003890 [Glutinoglossum americanum]
MWHHNYQHSPKNIQSRLKKTFPELYGSYPETVDMAPAIEGHIAMLQSQWAPKDWLNVDPSKKSWSWMLRIHNENLLLEGGVPNYVLAYGGIDDDIRIGGVGGGSGVFVHPEEAQDGVEDYEDVNATGDDWESDSQGGGDETEASSQESDGHSEFEVVVDLDEISRELVGQGEVLLACVEIHLDDSVDYLTLTDD